MADRVQVRETRLDKRHAHLSLLLRPPLDFSALLRRLSSAHRCERRSLCSLFVKTALSHLVNEHSRHRACPRPREWPRCSPSAAQFRALPPLPQLRPLHAHEWPWGRSCQHKRFVRARPPVSQLAAGKLQCLAGRHGEQLHPRQSMLRCQVRFLVIVIALFVPSLSKIRILCRWWQRLCRLDLSSTPSKRRTIPI